MGKKRRPIKERKYGDSEDEGQDLTPGYPGTPPPTPEGGWIPYTAAKIENVHDPPPGGCHPPMAEDPVDIRRFDLIVGKIIFAKLHPMQPDTWMLTYVDVGWEFPLPVVSSIGKFYDKLALEKRKVVALCNIEPMQGLRNVANTAMLMCGAAADSENPDSLVYELWEVPKKARIGDPLRCENYKLMADMLTPERPFMHNDEGVFDEIIADVKINSLRQVTYKDEKLFVRGLKGQYVTTPTLANCGVKKTFI